MNLKALFAERAGGLAVIDANGTPYSYSDILTIAASTLPLADTDIRRLILLETDNSIDCLAIYFAALMGDHPVLLCGPGQPGMLDRLDHAFQPDLIARPSEEGYAFDVRPASRRTVAPHPELAVLMSTSGSTGSPKYVRLSKGNIWANARSVEQYLGIRADDRGMLNLPMHYAYGLSIINSHIAAGAAIILNQRSFIDPEFWRFAQACGATSFAGVPHSYELLDHIGLAGCAPSSLRYFTQAGGRLPPERVRHYAELARERGWRFYVMYGQTEATARMAYLPPDHALEHPASIGVPIPDGRFRLRDANGSWIDEPETVGELVYDGPNVMMGYATHDGDLALPSGLGELLTGDLAMRNAAGFYEITGRTSRFIKIAGKRIGLDDVERLLEEAGQPAISTGMDGKLIVATTCEKAAEGISTSLSLRLQIPRHSVEVHHILEFPRTASGKIDYALLKSSLTAGRDEPESERHGAVIRNGPGIEEAFCLSFGDRARDLSASFLSLGGDSLNYLHMAMALEAHFGDLPDQWESRSIADLKAMANVPQPCPPAARVRRSRYSAAPNFDTLRGLACLLVVAYHVVGMNAVTGLRLVESSHWHAVMDALKFIRMPLFTAMAGYLYALMPPPSNEYVRFIRQKAQILMVPALFVGIVTWALRSIVYGPATGLLESLLNGYLHLWYLYALMAIFIVASLMDVFLRLSSSQWLLAVILVLLLRPFVPHVQLFSLSGALDLFPYFIFGLVLGRNPDWAKSDVVAVGAGTALVAYLACRDIFQLEIVGPQGFPMLTGLASLALIVCLFRLMPRVPALAWIGAYSFTIYLWHPVANAAVRSMIWSEGSSNVALIFCICLLSGVAIPIAVRKATQRIPFMSLPMTGTRFTRNIDRKRIRTGEAEHLA